MRRLKGGNIYSNIPRIKNKEISETIGTGKRFKIERIISRGQVTEKGKWLKDTHNEWVIVLRGAGKLRFKKGNRLINMNKGDHVLIPSNTLHRVEWTCPRQKTIWLAVYINNDDV